MMRFYIFIFFFITNIFASIKEQDICYDIKDIQKKMNKKENLTLSEIQFYSCYKSSLAQETHVATQAFWVL